MTAPGAPRTLFERIWSAHVVASLAPGVDLLDVDWHVLPELGSRVFRMLEERGLPVARPERHLAVMDHTISTEPGRTGGLAAWSAAHMAAVRKGCARHGIALLDVNDPDQGISHVVGPELGISQPGTLILCPDSHTSTHGALGALAWGIGSSEVMHVLATGAIAQRRPRTMRITLDGTLAAGVTAKDLALAVIARIGAAGAAGHAVEFAGSAVRALPVEARMTLCNLAPEMGGKIALVAPDEAVFAYLRGRRHAPGPEHWERAVAQWRGLASDPDAVFDREVSLDTAAVAPHVTWGTSPEHALPLAGGRAPDPAAEPDATRRRAWEAALDYMGLSPGQAMEGLPIQRVFIGSCTNARLSDLRDAASVLRGRRVAPGVEAWVVPGSQRVKRAAEAEGLDRLFLEAGFRWREPGCSLCLGGNGEIVAPGDRCVSTSNRNFVGRQGPGARTHLASPATAAAAALAGALVDPRL